MSKSGLVLLSLGFLLFVVSANAKTGTYNIFNLTTAIFLIAVGIYFIIRDKKKTKKD
ncbi:hypothetical protein [Paraliobacillus salinarum]|uniref:hypothetical protein n=1 Tax=Paraliobacillus salinarum TaxID=1158996 RepID=UPI0015F55395|nr:hypothetical protein [Paraliobacillus salinarum]